MLCEQCQTKEATVHFSSVAWPSGADTKHLCETCYPEVEAERTASYGPDVKPLPVIYVERITAQEYLAFAAKARANGADAPAFRHISERLKGLPATRERLAIETLTMAWQSLEKGDDAWDLIGLGTCFGNSVSGAKVPAFIELLERIVLRSIELMGQSPNGQVDHPFGLGLTMAAKTLRRADHGRLSTVLKNLKSQPPYRALPATGEVLAYLEQKMHRKGGVRR